MPTDSSQHELDHDRSTDRGDGADRGGSKQKAKDLSHVPCKFFKVGGCTAGSSCPFSHTSVEPGQQKEVCTWFVKGNCKFGHKCALAHILPGQSMTMDRKNKKAAQAAAGGGDKGGKAGGKGGKRENAVGGGPGAARLPLLAGGSTAPTRILTTGSSGPLSSGRPPMNMPLKATISPSAPAPPLKDTDFTSFATLDEMEGVNSNTPSDSTSRDTSTDVHPPTSNPEVPPKSGTPMPVALPLSAPRPSANTPTTNDFGPIGSPPNYRSQAGQQTSPSRPNGATFSPPTSPRVHSNLNGSSSQAVAAIGILSSSPFSAPGSQTAFMSSSYTGGGMAASLGSGLTMMGGRKGWGDAPERDGATSFSGLLSTQLSSSVAGNVNGFGARGEYEISFEEYGGGRNARRIGRADEVVVEDEDLEDFIPSSLTDLLTPEERKRRMSRTGSGQPPHASHLTNAMASAGGDTGGPAPPGNGNLGFGHRYSRSVPASSLLGDLKSIWSDPSAPPLPSSPPTHRATPSASYTSRFDPLHSGHDDMGMSISMGSAGTASSMGMLSPSNASAAFLPGVHQHYLSAKAKQAQAQQQAQLGHGGVGRNLRGASNPLFAGSGNTSLVTNYLQPMAGLGIPSSASNSPGLHTHTHGNTTTTYRTTPSPFDLTQGQHQQILSQTARPIPSGKADDLAPHLLSPSSRALQAHAPGQSLPQGLAAGYSRIHALPPLANLASPPTSGSFIPGTSPGAAVAMSSFGQEPMYNNDWMGQGRVQQQQQQGAVSGKGADTGLESMLSRMSYSAAAGTARGGGGTGHNPPPGLTKNTRDGPLSPLSGPVVTDDDLFDMDK